MASTEGHTAKARPQSTLALDFSAALDEMFKLNGVGALELSVEEKKSEVHLQKFQLDDLDAKLRETTDRMKKLEAKHRRRQSQMGLGGRQPVRPVVEENEQETDDSGGDSDVHGRTSPQSDAGQRRS